MASRSEHDCYRGDQPTPMADGGDSLLDRILEGLAQPRSRRVLYCLADAEPQDINELARAVAELEEGSNPTAKECERVKIEIYHNILPKLSNLQLLEYDARSQTVCFRQSPPELDEFLRLCRRFDAEEA